MEMELIYSVDSECADLESFEKALTIWIKKPHVANRRLCGSEVIFEISWSLSEIKEKLFLEPAIFSAINIKFANNESLLKLMIRKLRDAVQLLEIGNDCSEKTNYHILLRHLISKNPRVKGSYELVIQSLHVFSPFAYFLTLCEDDIRDYDSNIFDCYAYKLSLDVTNKKIELYCHADYRSSFNSNSFGSTLVDNNGGNSVIYDDIKAIFPSISWLSNTLLRKVASWSQEKCLDTRIKSLRLVNMGSYIEKYNELKERYSRHLIEMWTESTDPLKFVYEDIGIAAYLLVLWKSLDEKRCDEANSERVTKKSKVFVDLGCGNGLLVYLLNAEGHCGYGVDIRKRKIWESLKPKADLREFTVLPCEENPFPGADWLIGNHSDELTPWISVMAARNQNDRCHYFVLPCCPWDFTSKFISRKLHNGPKVAGKYEEYLNYIEEVGKVCGFKVDRDTLRIPSTRRVCFIGLRLYEDSKLDRLKAINMYIESRCHSIQNASKKRLGEDVRESHCKMSKQENLVEKDREINFQPRSPGEAKRGSLNIDPSFLEIICVKVMEHLLKMENFVDIIAKDGIDINLKKWNKGGSMPLVEICTLCDANQLKILKSSPGGIQTVLKNCPDVFSIRNGEVTLRDWSSTQFKDFIMHRQTKKKQNKIKTKSRAKTKICFFYRYHPNKCLLKKEDCKFSHGIEDLDH